MWILFAFLSALAASLSAIFAKCGIKRTDSTVVTALRTLVVLIFAWIIVFSLGLQHDITDISGSSLAFLLLSGVTTGASWLFYYAALKYGNVSKVAAVDKFSTVLTLIGSMLILHEISSLYIRITCIVIMTVGTLLMASYKGRSSNKRWFLYALISAVCAAATTILAKVGLNGVNSDLAVAIRTAVVLIMALVIMFIKGIRTGIGRVPANELVFIIFSGIATGVSWLFYFRALKYGDTAIVTSIDKMSIVFTVALAALFLKEHVSWKSVCGLMLIVIGILLMIFCI